jgi:hypothetical protein
MAEEKKTPYIRRALGTKDRAQRLDISYQRHLPKFLTAKWTLTAAAIAVACALSIPLLSGLGGSRKLLVNGPISRSHAMFEQNCQSCHEPAFQGVSNTKCQSCHDAPSHPAKSIDTAKLIGEPSCAQCHLEHSGKPFLADVADGNCTTCHANLTAHGEGVKLASVNIRAFRPGKHPEFSSSKLQDLRPLKLNHAAHMPAQTKNVGKIQLPMKCVDCHQTDTKSENGALKPVTFEEHCRSCHKRELEFDIYAVLGESAAPSPHTKDPATIRAAIRETYAKYVTEHPEVLQRPLRNELDTLGRDAWIERVSKDSERFLFDRKCVYCHEYQGETDGMPVVKLVSPIKGLYNAAAPRSPLPSFFKRGEFAHRDHRPVTCESCHAEARSSKLTADVNIPKMESCTACHGNSGTPLDRCGSCHIYHNRDKETDKERRSIDEINRGK